jgi:hypothetical protein
MVIFDLSVLLEPAYKIEEDVVDIVNICQDS